LLEESLFGWIANWSLTVPLRILTSLNEFHHLLAKYGERKSERWTFDLSKMLKGKILFQDSKTQWLIQLADFAANTWAQTIGDYVSEAVCDWSIVGDRCRADRQSSVAVVAGEDSKPARFEVS
jgi:hypothetical protein